MKSSGLPQPVGLLQVCVVPAAVLLMAGAAAAQEDTRSEFWPELSVYSRLAPTYRLFFNYAPAVSPTDNHAEGALGAALEVGLFPILRSEQAKRFDEDRLRFLRLRVGLRYAASLPASEESSTEWRGILQLTGRARLPWQVLGSLRNLLELRWLDAGLSLRYRLRLGFEKDVQVLSDYALTPFLSAEAFYDARFDVWNRVRYRLGVAFPVTRGVSIKAYYARQEELRSQPTHINAFGLGVALFF